MCKYFSMVYLSELWMITAWLCCICKITVCTNESSKAVVPDAHSRFLNDLRKHQTSRQFTWDYSVTTFYIFSKLSKNIVSLMAQKQCMYNFRTWVKWVKELNWYIFQIVFKKKKKKIFILRVAPTSMLSPVVILCAPCSAFRWYWRL